MTTARYFREFVQGSEQAIGKLSFKGVSLNLTTGFHSSLEYKKPKD